MKNNISRIKKRLKSEINKRNRKKYMLHLYVAGLSPQSQNAISNIKKLCEEHLQDRCDLRIHDIYKNPIIAKNGQILAAPTLIKQLPLPLRRFVGDMSNKQKLLAGLDIRSDK